MARSRRQGTAWAPIASTSSTAWTPHPWPTGTWIDVDSLDFTSPVASPVGATDGNNAANRLAISGTIDGISLTSGATFWIRWSTKTCPVSDDGLGIDDFSLTPHVDDSVNLFINEIHYDNDGTDVGEAIEIAGPAGTDLTGWSLVLYNGATGLSYQTQLTDPVALSGVIPNLQNGMGVLTFNYGFNGIQNGAPDGVALVNGTTVVQFLSDEGSFTAANGPAVGMLSHRYRRG